MTTAQKIAKEKFKKAIAYRQKSGVSLKEAFAHVYGKKKVARKKIAKKRIAGPKDSSLVRKELIRKGLKMPHGYTTTKRKRKIGSVKKKKITEQGILNKIHIVKRNVDKLDEAQHKHMLGTIKKNFKNFIVYKKHIIDVIETPSGKKMYFASVHPLGMPFSSSQLSIAKKWIDKHIAIKRIKSSK